MAGLSRCVRPGFFYREDPFLPAQAKGGFTPPSSLVVGMGLFTMSEAECPSRCWGGPERVAGEGSVRRL